MSQATSTPHLDKNHQPSVNSQSRFEGNELLNSEEYGADLEKASLASESAKLTAQAESDPNVINWDGLGDPENPLNWTPRKKWANVILVASLTLLTPFGSSMFAPAVPEVMSEFKSTNIDLASFVVSVYILGYAFGPLIIAPMSELYGRLPVYHVNTILFIVFNVACANSTGLSMLIVFRFFAGVAGSCPLTVGSGTIADCFKQEERGKVMSAWTLPVLLGPTLGPVVGGYLSEALGWQWDFWFLVIATGTFFVFSLIFQRETYPPILLEQKVRRLRKETENPHLRSALESSKTPLHLFAISIIRPTKMLFLSPIIFGLSLYIAILYGYLYLAFTTMSEVFEGQYGISSGNVGLTYLGVGVGNFGGLIAFGAFSDHLLKRAAAANGGEMKAEYRLQGLLPAGLMMPVGLFWYGWSSYYKVHWIVPIIGTVFLGSGMILVSMPVFTYLVDAYTVYAASAMAANTVLRSLGGALLPLCGRILYQELGLGWGNSLLALLALGLLPPLWLLVKNGEKVRTHPRFQMKL